MVRPLLVVTVVYTAGVTAGHLARPWPAVPLVLGCLCLAAAVLARVPRALLAAVFLAGALMSALAWSRLGPGPADVLLVGAGSAGLSEAVREGGLPARWVVVDGAVASEPRPAGDQRSSSFLLRAEAAGPYWRRGEVLHVVVRSGPGSGLGPGDRLRVAGFLSRPRSPGNPGEFNFPLHLAVSGVRYTLAARWCAPAPGNLGGPRGGLRGLAGRAAAACRGLRDRLLDRVAAALPAGEAALLASLVFGDTSRLPEDVARDFRRSGVYHILAVSGSNVAFVASGFWLAARLALAAVGLRGRPADRLVLPATAAVLPAYAVMAGLGPSVVRATLMAEAGLVYLWLDRRRELGAPVCLAALVMLTVRPLAITDVGFQLSYAATLGILALYPPLRRWASPAGRRAVLPRPLRGPAAAVSQVALVSLAAQAAVAPLLALHFGEVSVVGLAANTVVVPLAGLAVTAGLGAGGAAMCGPLGGLLGGPLFSLTSLLLKATAGAARLAAGVPLASLVVGSPPLPVVVGYYAALLWVLRGAGLGRARRRVLLSLVAAGAVVVAGLGTGLAVRAVRGPEVEVVFLDVGQGDAAVIHLPGRRAVLIDAGPAGAGRRVVVPYLKHRGQGRLDVVFLSHLHDDHVVGLVEVLADPSLSVGAIVTRPGALSAPRPPGFDLVLASAAARGVPVLEARAGARLSSGRGWGALVVLAAGGEALGIGESSVENNRSLVLQLLTCGVTFLFPGDLEGAGEEALRGGVPAGELASLVLKVSHHGSLYATTESFLAAVRPGLAVISAGANTFGHPAPATVQRLEDAGAAVVVTRVEGAVRCVASAGRLRVTCFRSGRFLTAPDPAGEEGAS